MSIRKLFFFFTLVFATFSFITSCKKTDVREATNISFSSRLIKFDTVFTTISSETRRLLIYNNNDHGVLIKDIYLKREESSFFRINIDGVASTRYRDFYIRANDSVYVFVEFTINPNNVNNPFLITDSLVVNTNNNQFQYVALEAIGQDAHFFSGKRISPNLPLISCLDGDCDNNKSPVTITWKNDKPYVIFDYLVIDSLDKLIIEEGVRVHFYNNSGLWVFKDGNIKVNGTVANPVTFEGTRLGRAYTNTPGQWDRIIVNQGTLDNEFNHAIIKNGFIGIQAEPFNKAPNSKSSNKLKINGCEIKNFSLSGLFLTNFITEDKNSIIANCGVAGIYAQGNNTLDFKHTTIANYWNFSIRNTPAVLVRNSYTFNNTEYIYTVDTVAFYNSIITGFNTDEIALEVTKNGQMGAIKYGFYNCAINTELDIANNSRFLNTVHNPSQSIFKNATKQNFEIVSSSPTINKGLNGLGILIDHKGVSRKDGKPDIGAFEN